MPDRPAPTMSTSTCSAVMLGSFAAKAKGRVAGSRKQPGPWMVRSGRQLVVVGPDRVRERGDGVARDLLEEGRSDLEDLLVDGELRVVQRDLRLVRTAGAEAHVAAGQLFQIERKILAAHAGVIHGRQPRLADHLGGGAAGQLGFQGA